MTCKDVMTPYPKMVSTSANAQAAARIMQVEDVGAIPIVKEKTQKLIGMVTDRDLCLEVVAKGRNPQQVPVSDCMSAVLITCKLGDDIQDCERLMKTYQVRRIPVVDEHGCCVGIISQGDLALKVDQAQEVHDTVREISKPGHSIAA
jgi:CBS domain-containing protein